MKLAICGSRYISSLNLEEYLPSGVKEIVSGGALGVDKLAADYAVSHGIRLVEFLPDYKRYGRRAPLVRNAQIADYADELLAFPKSDSRGTYHTIKLFEKRNKPVNVVICDD